MKRASGWLPLTIGLLALGCGLPPEDSSEELDQGTEGVVLAAGNLLTNPSFETNTAGWASWHGSLGRVATLSAPEGGYVARVTRTTGTEYALDNWPGPTLSLPAGTPLRAKAWVRAASTSAIGKPIRLYIRELSANGAILKQAASTTVLLTKSFAPLEASSTLSAGGDSADVYLMQFSAAPFDAFFADAIELTVSPGVDPSPVPAPAPAPSGCLPFDPPSIATLRASPKKVFAHYFSPFPLSLDNAVPTVDYYARNYLQPAGENGKFAFCGGFIKQRPLPQPPRAAGADWESLNLQQEVRRAAAIGIDGFTFDILSTSGRNWNRLLKLLDAAQVAAPEFKIALMPDMTSTFTGTDVDARAAFVSAISAVASHPSTYRVPDGRLLLAPFYPDRRTASWWSATLTELQGKGIGVALWPVYVTPWAASTDALKAVVPLYGTSSWGPRTVAGALGYLDKASQAHSRGLKWMGPVAPQDSRPKDLVYTEANNSQAMRALWDSTIRGGADWAQLITWNDYSEATEISPSSGTQWALYDLSAYYIAWFKSGVAPTLTRDALYYFHRKMSTTAAPDLTQQSAPYRVVNGAAPANEIELLAFLTAPGTLEITIGGSTHQLAVGAGVQSLRVPLVEGTPTFRLLRNGGVVQSVESAFPISNRVTYQDLLYRSGGSLTCDRGALMQ